MLAKLRLVVVLVLVLAPGVARTQPVRQTAEAEQLFREGRELIKAGKTAEACEAFAGSQRLEPNPATVMNLADCRERNGELASAWAQFLIAIGLLRNDPAAAATMQSARARATALEPRLSRLTIDVPADNRIDGLTIRRNDAVIDPATWSRAMPVDGGAYAISAEAAGHAPWTTTVTMGRERDAQTIFVPRLAGVAVPGPAAVDDPLRAGGAAQLDRAPVRKGLPRRRKLAIVAGTTAVAVLGGALAFELSGRGVLRTYEAAPAEGPMREALYDSANRRHQLAQGLAVAGAAGIGVAVYLWVTGAAGGDARSAAMRPALTPHLAGLVLTGGF